MSIEKMLEVMSNLDRQTRSRYHLTLGNLIALLEAAHPSVPVRTADGRNVGRLGSYRGYYADLALSPADTEITAASLLEAAKAAVGVTFAGYKGGDFLMDEDTPLWVAPFGCCGEAVIAAREQDGAIVLETREVDL